MCPLTLHFSLYFFVKRFFEVKPEAQKMFPAFADVDKEELPTNKDFLAQASSCVSGLNSYVQHLGENPKNCPFIAKARGKYHQDDLKVLYLLAN